MADNINDANREEVRVVFDPKEPITVRLTTDAADEMEIDLVKAWGVLLKHWKQVAVITLIFAVLGLGVAYWRYAPADADSGAAVTAQVDLLEAVPVRPDMDYDDLFEGAEKYYTGMLQYLDAVNTYLSSTNYAQKSTEISALNELRIEMVDKYDDTIMLAGNIHRFYDLIQPADMENKLLELSTRQRELTREINYLQQEIAFLSSLAVAGTDAENPVSVEATLKGMEKVRELEMCQDEYEDNAVLLDQLSGVADNAERLRQTEYADELIIDGLAAIEEYAEELNQMAQKLAVDVPLNIAAEWVFDAANLTAPAVYTVAVTAPPAAASATTNFMLTIVIMAILGFGLACVWVVWRYYRKEA
ncbi:MAG: hypothetical protein Q4B48_01150 [Syntrophomonadaceae bacterium]|nr:hypothetical protein [Syntrophomonadaceae bacterium]